MARFELAYTLLGLVVYKTTAHHRLSYMTINRHFVEVYARNAEKLWRRMRFTVAATTQHGYFASAERKVVYACKCSKTCIGGSSRDRTSALGLLLCTVRTERSISPRHMMPVLPLN